jgi:RNA polymerase sigma-70 factor (ECF subfamily)
VFSGISPEHFILSFASAGWHGETTPFMEVILALKLDSTAGSVCTIRIFFDTVVTKRWLLNPNHTNESKMQKEELFRKALGENEGRIFRICRYYFSDADERNDAFQESLIRIWEKLGSFRNESRLNTWIYRVVVNTCLTSIRKEKRRRGLFENSSRMDSLQLSDPHPSDLERTGEQKIQFFNSFMEQLGTLDRMLVSLYLEEFDTREMAEVTGLSESNVRVKIHRIKEQIIKEWEEKENGAG